MIRKNILLGLLSMGTALGLHAQKKTDRAHVKWGMDMQVKTDGLFQYIIDDTGNSTYMLMTRKKDRYIQRMDGLNVAYQKPLELELDKKDLKLERVLLTKDAVVVFSSKYDKHEDRFQLYASTYSQDGFTPGKRFEKVAYIHAEHARKTGGFTIEQSADRSKVLVESLVPYDKEAKEKFELKVFDDAMGQLWSQEVEMPYQDSEFGVESTRLTNDGSVVMLCTKYAEKQEKREKKRAGKPTYEYHLLVFTKDSPVAQDHTITVADKFLQDMTLSMGKEGDIICAGLFGNEGSFNVRGTFFLRLDPSTKQVVHESYKEFSNDFITSYMSEKQAKKATRKADRKGKELELPEYDLHDIIHRDDGGAVLVAEQFRVYTICTSDGRGNTYCSTHYIYNDVIVVNIDPEGNIQWAVKVPKRQHSVNDGGIYSSYAVEVKGDKIYLVFNDSGENLFLKPGDKVHQFELKGKDALVVLATVDSDGHVSREALFSPERRDVILRPKDCAELSNDEMFIYASRRKDYRFGTITFE